MTRLWKDAPPHRSTRTMFAQRYVESQNLFPRDELLILSAVDNINDDNWHDRPLNADNVSKIAASVSAIETWAEKNEDRSLILSPPNRFGLYLDRYGGELFNDTLLEIAELAIRIAQGRMCGHVCNHLLQGIVMLNNETLLRQGNN